MKKKARHPEKVNKPINPIKIIIITTIYFGFSKSTSIIQYIYILIIRKFNIKKI